MRIHFFTTVISFLLIHGCSGARLPDCWCTKILQLCEDFSDDQPTLPTVESAFYLRYIQDISCESIVFLFPSVILWSPLEQFKDLLQTPVFCPKCSSSGQDNVSLYPVGWRSGTQGERSEPRKIYGTDGITLLVGRVYKCTLRRHEIVGYHPYIIQQVPQRFIPFMLWHKTGFTTDFIELVAILVAAGMNLSTIRDFYQKRVQSLYYCRKMQFDQISARRSDSSPFPSPAIWKRSLPIFIPSVHALSGCFLVDFWAKEFAYTLHMQSMTIDESNPWLSLDHTFSSASK